MAGSVCPREVVKNVVEKMNMKEFTVSLSWMVSFLVLKILRLLSLFGMGGWSYKQSEENYAPPPPPTQNSGFFLKQTLNFNIPLINHTLKEWDHVPNMFMSFYKYLFLEVIKHPLRFRLVYSMIFIVCKHFLYIFILLWCISYSDCLWYNRE